MSLQVTTNNKLGTEIHWSTAFTVYAELQLQTTYKHTLSMDLIKTSLENWKKSKKIGIEVKNKGFFRKSLWIFHFFRNFSQIEKN